MSIFGDTFIAIGALSVLTFLGVLAWLAWAAMGDVKARWRRRGARWHLHLPLFLVRALTWRRRKRSRCRVLTDAVLIPLTKDQEKALAELERHLR